MTDIHSHILPGMDDGSRSTEESLAMLAASAAQGVRAIAATPHFYAMENSPEEFLARRAAAVARLLIPFDIPSPATGSPACPGSGWGRRWAISRA